MTKKTENDVLREIERTLELDPGSIKSNSLAENVDGWDSMGHLSILLALDKMFEGKVAGISEIAEANSIPKVLQGLRQHSLI